MDDVKARLLQAIDGQDVGSISLLLTDALGVIATLEHKLRYEPPEVSRKLLVEFSAAAIERHRDNWKADTPHALAEAVVDNAARKGLLRFREA